MSNDFKKADAFLNLTIVGKNGERKIDKGLPLYSDDPVHAMLIAAHEGNSSIVVNLRGVIKKNGGETTSLGDFEL